MSAASGMCASSFGLAAARCAYDRQTYGDPAPARTAWRVAPDAGRRAASGASRGCSPALGKASRLPCEPACTPTRCTHPSHPRSFS